MKNPKFDKWINGLIKDGARIVDENEMRDSWNAAISSVIKLINNHYYDSLEEIIEKIKKLKDDPF